jgi:hypothetical protein
VFLVLSLRTLAQLIHSTVVLGVVLAAAALVVLGHAVIAQHRVYGETWTITTLKAVAVATLYSLLWSAASLGAALWIAIA